MIDTDKYEGLGEVIDRIINSDEIGVDDLLADSMAVKDGINELFAEVEELRAWKKFVSDIVKQQSGPHLREMLKEMIE